MSVARSARRVALLAALVLLVPLVAMQLTDGVAWSVADFVLAGVLLAGNVGALYELALRTPGSFVYRAIATVIGVAAIVAGEADDAPGLVGFGFLVVLGTIALAVRPSLARRVAPTRYPNSSVSAPVCGPCQLPQQRCRRLPVLGDALDRASQRVESPLQVLRYAVRSVQRSQVQASTMSGASTLAPLHGGEFPNPASSRSPSCVGSRDERHPTTRLPRRPLAGRGPRPHLLPRRARHASGRARRVRAVGGGTCFGIWQPEQQGMQFVPQKGNPWPLGVDDVPAARAELEAKGVQFFGDTLDTGVCHMAFFNDPDGNDLMLHHRYAPYED